MRWLEHEYVAAASAREVGRRPIGREVFGEQLVLARDSQGAPFALRDGCPHRGAPLSKGAMVGDSLECPYHGIHFGRDGVAGLVPWSDGPCGLKAKSFAVLEQDGLIFVSGSEAASPPPALLAAPVEDGWRRLALRQRIDAPYGEVVENFMDSTHTGVVHAGLIRSATQRRAREVSVVSDGRSVTVEHGALDEDLGVARRWLGPGLISHRDVCAVPGTVTVEYFVDGKLFFRALVFVTPRDEGRSEVFVRAAFSSPRSGGWWHDAGRGVADRLAGWVAPLVGRRVLRQDRAILEATERAVAAAGRRPRGYLGAEVMHRMVHGLLLGEGREEEATVTLVL